MVQATLTSIQRPTSRHTPDNPHFSTSSSNTTNAKTTESSFPYLATIR